MVRWYNKYRKRMDNEYLAEVVVPKKMYRQEYPVRFYGRDKLHHDKAQLHDAGYIKEVRFHDEKIGYVLSEKGMNTLEELGTPQQYDH